MFLSLEEKLAEGRVYLIILLLFSPTPSMEPDMNKVLMNS